MKINVKDYIDKGCSRLGDVCSLYVDFEGCILDTSGKCSDDFLTEIDSIHKRLGIFMGYEEIVKADQWHYGVYKLESAKGTSYIVPNTAFIKKEIMEAVEGLFIEQFNFDE